MVQRYRVQGVLGWFRDTGYRVSKGGSEIHSVLGWYRDTGCLRVVQRYRVQGVLGWLRDT